MYIEKVSRFRRFEEGRRSFCVKKIILYIFDFDQKILYCVHLLLFFFIPCIIFLLPSFVDNEWSAQKIYDHIRRT